MRTHGPKSSVAHASQRHICELFWQPLASWVGARCSNHCSTGPKQLHFRVTPIFKEKPKGSQPFWVDLFLKLPFGVVPKGSPIGKHHKFRGARYLCVCVFLFLFDMLSGRQALCEPHAFRGFFFFRGGLTRRRQICCLASGAAPRRWSPACSRSPDRGATPPRQSEATSGRKAAVLYMSPRKALKPPKKGTCKLELLQKRRAAELPERKPGLLNDAQGLKGENEGHEKRTILSFRIRGPNSTRTPAA